MKWVEDKGEERERIYQSGEWRMSVNNDRGMYISNWDLLITPSGSGATEREALEAMLVKIAEYRNKLTIAESEIRESLSEMQIAEIRSEQDANKTRRTNRSKLGWKI